MSSDSVNLKKLMRIIYQKEKEVDKFRKQLKEKDRQRIIPAEVVKNVHQQEGISKEERETLTRQVHENRQILDRAGRKMAEMEAQIAQLQADLDQEEKNTQAITKQLQETKLALSLKEELVSQLRTEINLLHSSKKIVREEMASSGIELENLRIENQKLKLIVQELHQQKLSFSNRFQSAEREISKYLINLQRRSNRNGPRSTTELVFSRIQNRREKKIKTQLTIDKIEDSFEGKFKEIVEILTGWEESLARREQEWKRKFQDSLCDNSIDGISNLIKESFYCATHNQQSPEDANFQDSQFKRNEEKFLEELERQCQQSLPADTHEKQKMVELSEVKQSLKMTKEVNAQLYEQLGKQEKVISLFKQTFSSMQAKKMFKKEDAEQVVKIRKVLGTRN